MNNRVVVAAVALASAGLASVCCIGPLVKTVRSLACPSCEVVVYDLNKGCATNECRGKAKAYGIKRLPAVAVDGRLVECCVQGGVDEAKLRDAGIGLA